MQQSSPTNPETENPRAVRVGNQRFAGVILLVLFFLSGGCGLVLECAWLRLLRLVMGNTTHAVTTVLAAFMAGLAVGAVLGGRRADDPDARPLRLYAILEAVVGLYALAMPFLLNAAEPLYQLAWQSLPQNPMLLTFLRFAVSSLILVIPTACMGASLPVLAAWFARSTTHPGRPIGRLYALNTFGAVLGAVAAGFLLLPRLGLSLTMTLTAAANLLIALVAAVMHTAMSGTRPGQSPAVIAGHDNDDTVRSPAPATQSATQSSRLTTVLLIGYGLSGLAALAYEVAWTRVLAMLLGSSTYAFSLMLAGFILGLALGAAVMAVLIPRIKKPLLVLGLIELAIAVTALATVPWLAHLPITVARLVARYAEHYQQLLLIKALLCLAVMLLPTTLMGSAFPLAAQLLTRYTRRPGRGTGTTYAVNTFGSILGSILAGFLLIPLIGLRRTIITIVALNTLIACLFFLVAAIRPRWKTAAMTASLLLTTVLIAVLPAWDPAILASGPALYASTFTGPQADNSAAITQRMKRAEVLFHQQDATTTVTVRKDPSGELILAVNGKTDATSRSDLATQTLLAHAPILTTATPRDVLVIGLASGITLGTAARYPAVETLDCAELSTAVLRACRFFSHVNHDVLDDPRTHIILADGRNHLALDPATYDVIISEPSNPWIAGVADLFTREFFQLCSRRLNPHGRCCVWLQAYDMDPNAFNSVIRTFHAVFPHMLIVEATPMADYLLIGSNEPITRHYDAILQTMRQPAVADELARIGIHTPAEFLAHFVTDTTPPITALTAEAPLHTDDNALLEYATPRTLYNAPNPCQLLQELNRHREPTFQWITHAPVDTADHLDWHTQRQLAQRLVHARQLAQRAVCAWQADDKPHAHQLALQAARLDPTGPPTLNRYAAAIIARHRPLGNQPCTLAERITLYQAAIDIAPNFVPAHINLALAATQRDRWPLAMNAYRRVLEINPHHTIARHNLAWLLATCPDPAFRDGPQALAIAHALVKQTQRTDPLFLRALAAAYAETDRFAQATDTAEQALQLARSQQKTKLAARIAEQLDHYRHNRPVRRARNQP